MKTNAFVLAVLLFLDALALALGIGAAARVNLQHLLGGGGGDGGPVGVGVVILMMVAAVAAAGALTAGIWAAVTTPKEGPIAWRPALTGVTVGFNFLLPIAIATSEPPLIAGVVVPTALLVAARWRSPERPLRWAAAPLALVAVAALVVATVRGTRDAYDRAESDRFGALRASLADGGVDEVRALLDRSDVTAQDNAGQLECEALLHERLDLVDLLLERMPPSGDRDVALMRAIRAGDTAALRAALRIPRRPADSEECEPAIVVLSICDRRLALDDLWLAALGGPAKLLDAVVDGLAGRRVVCADELRTFLERNQVIVPPGRIDPRFYDALAPRLAEALYRDNHSDSNYSERPDSPFAAWLAGRLAWPPMMGAAIRANEAPLVKWIARHQPRLDTTDGCGVTPLVAAVVAGQSELADWLLAHGADANLPARPACGAPPLPPLIVHLQKKPEDQGMEMLPTLLRHKADPKARAPSGEDALALARKTGDRYTINSILEALGQPREPDENP